MYLVGQSMDRQNVCQTGLNRSHLTLSDLYLAIGAAGFLVIGRIQPIDFQN